MISREFVTAGKAIFTIEVPINFQLQYNNVKPHYTYRINFKKGEGQWNDTYFINLLTGPDNSSPYDYTCFALLDANSGKISLTRKTRLTDNSWPVKILRRVLANIWQGTGHRIEESGFKVHHEGRCGRCGRRLTVPSSIESGIGPECATRI